jgi:hypothetical protein
MSGTSIFAYSQRLAILAVAAGGALLAAQPAAAAALVQWDLTGAPGTQTFVAPSFVAANLSGLNITESGVTPNAGGNSINASNWAVGDYFAFGLTANSGYSATLTQLQIATRSSNTGPGFMDLLVSVDSGAFVTLTTIAQSGTTTNNAIYNFGPLSGTSFVFRLTPVNSTSANGGTIGTAGTFRIANYSNGSSFLPVSLEGSVSAVVAVPEPATWGLMILGFGAAGAMLRTRRSVRFA